MTTPVNSYLSRDQIFAGCEPINEEQITTDLSFGDFDTMVRQQASLRTHYGVQHARYYHAFKRAKSNLEYVEASVDIDIRRRAEESGEKLSEAKVTARVNANAFYTHALELLDEADMYSTMMNQVISGLDSRRDMLVQHSKHLLIERDGELRLSSDLSSAEQAAKAALRTAA